MKTAGVCIDDVEKICWFITPGVTGRGKKVGQYIIITIAMK